MIIFKLSEESVKKVIYTMTGFVTGLSLSIIFNELKEELKMKKEKNDYGA